MRIFIAINLPAPAQKELARLVKKWEKFYWPVRWEKLEKIHLTLAFLGELKRQNLKLLEKVIRQGIKDVASFEVGVKGLGCFPDFVRPRIVWLGLKGDLQNLARLQKQINRELISAGFEFRQRPFQPHLTIGRVKKGISQGALADLGKKIRQHRQIDFKSTLRINSVAVMKSRLARPTSIYTDLTTVFFSNKIEKKE